MTTSTIAALFGEDHGRTDQFGLSVVGGPLSGNSATACGLSAGSEGVLTRKGPSLVLNEDCVLAFDDGRRVIQAVADGHHGHKHTTQQLPLLVAACRTASLRRSTSTTSTVVSSLSRPNLAGARSEVRVAAASQPGPLAGTHDPAVAPCH